MILSHTKQIMKIFEDTAYVRMGGSPEELKTAQYLQQKCAELGLDAKLEAFDVDMAVIDIFVKIIQTNKKKQ